MRLLRYTILMIVVGAVLAVWNVDGAQKPADKDVAVKEKAESERPDVYTLRMAGVGTDAASLLAYVKKNTGNDNDLLKLDARLRQLGSEEPKEREEAAKKIVQLGPAALVKLREAAKGDSDAERLRGVRQCIKDIETNWKPYVLMAATRLAIQLKSEGTAETLLRLLPYAGLGEEYETDVAYALDDLAKRDANVRAFLEGALADAMPVRRMIAGCVLGHRGNEAQREKVRNLLSDADVWVQLRAAQGLLASGDKTAIPALIRLLETAPVYAAWQAEELLRVAAGDTSPSVAVGAGSKDLRATCRAAWEKWWKDDGARVDLSAERRVGDCPILLLGWTSSKATEPGRVILFGHDGETRWSIQQSNLSPQDALFSPVEGLVVASIPDARRLNVPGADVSGLRELALDGTARWQTSEGRICSELQLSPDGNILVGTGASVVGSFTQTGHAKEAFQLKKSPGGWTGMARFLATDRILAFRADNQRFTLVELDPRTAEELWHTSVRTDRTRCSVKPLRSGNFLIRGSGIREDNDNTNGRTGNIVEVDRSGKIVWASLRGSSDVIRLRNGNTLVAGDDAGGLAPIWMEVTPQDRVVGEYYRRLGRTSSARLCFEMLRLGFDDPTGPIVDLEKNPSRRLPDLASRDPWVRRRAVYMLGKQGNLLEEREVQGLIAALADPDEGVRQTTVEKSFANVRREFLPLLIAEVKSPNPQARKGALSTLGRFRDQQERVLPILLAARKDPDPHVRHEALRNLGRYGPTNRDVINAITESLGQLALIDGKPGESDAAMALWYLNHFARVMEAPRYQETFRASLPAIERAAKDKDYTTRLFAVLVLGDLGKEARSSVPLLLPLLQSNDVSDPAARTSLRVSAAGALGEIGQGAKQALPQLEMMAKEDVSEIREAALEAIRRIGRD
jgi:HEAT repeat protein